MSAHTFFEVLAYAVGFRLYLWQRRRFGDAIGSETRWSIVAAAILGAAIGARVFYWLEDPRATIAHWNDLAYLFGGKTVIGALVGGTAAVEITKRWIGVTTRTGDLFAVPIAAGIAIGRIGCFLAGLPDRTYGVPTSLPWAVDFGDGIPRHPTQLYESMAMAIVAAGLAWWQRRPHAEGDLYRAVIVAYLALRLGVDALKPGPRLALGLTALQWTALAGLLAYAHDVRRWLAAWHERRAPDTPDTSGTSDTTRRSH